MSQNVLLCRGKIHSLSVINACSLILPWLLQNHALPVLTADNITEEGMKLPVWNCATIKAAPSIIETEGTRFLKAAAGRTLSTCLTAFPVCPSYCLSVCQNREIDPHHSQPTATTTKKMLAMVQEVFVAGSSVQLLTTHI